MPHSRENLEKLHSLVSQIANEIGNEWLLQQLRSNFGIASELVSTDTEKSIKKIYEFCVKEVIQKQAQSFYDSFKIVGIKQKLKFDFIRMEHFRREDNFEDFSLALHQQIENIINHLAENNYEFRLTILNNKDKLTYKIRHKTGVFDQFNLSHLILSGFATQKEIDDVFKEDIFEWKYSQKLKAVLYFFVFKQKIYNYYDFKSLYDVGNDIYQARNLNHRGGFLYDNQRETLNRIDGAKHKYYFKFLGFLETLTTHINDNL